MDLLPQPPAGDILYSYSRPDLVAVTHTHLELFVNFERHVLEGRAILTIEKKEPKCNELVLDTYELAITDVKNGDHVSTGSSLTFTHTENPHDDNFGRKLKITLPNVDNASSSSSKKKKVRSNIYKIQVIYETSPVSPALYWLKPHQTSDGRPLLISNSKFTYARAIFPCQDTPSNRTKFFSKIYVTSSLGLDVMMPGKKKKDDVDDKDEYTFHHLNRTIAMYQIYIIVGSLRNLHRKSRDDVPLDIWAEEKPCERCGEFLDKIMYILYKIKESYGFLGESVNVCVLPPNVPEFDMQYPDMTFVSSSLLEGQYSMIDTIVQNIIESWIGRAVAIDNFKHLWLIKGLSTFIYRNPKNDNIIDKENKLFRRDLQIKSVNNVLNMPELLNNVPLVPVLTKDLLPKNIIKYVSEKGCVFLNFLQDMLGGCKEFKDFLVNSLWPRFEKLEIREPTDHFKNILISHFSDKRKNEVLRKIEWDEWLNKSGFPSKPYTYENNKTHWQRQADLWIKQKTPSFDTIGLDKSNDLAIIEFLTYLLTLSTVLTAYQLQKIEHEFLGDQNICEIRFLWLQLCIKSEWLDHGRIQKDALKFACSEYCMPKYACPIFRDLYNLAQTRIMAIKSQFTARDNRSKMLPETINELSSILGVALEDRV